MTTKLEGAQLGCMEDHLELNFAACRFDLKD